MKLTSTGFGWRNLLCLTARTPLSKEATVLFASNKGVDYSLDCGATQPNLFFTRTESAGQIPRPAARQYLNTWWKKTDALTLIHNINWSWLLAPASGWGAWCSRGFAKWLTGFVVALLQLTTGQPYMAQKPFKWLLWEWVLVSRLSQWCKRSRQQPNLQRTSVFKLLLSSQQTKLLRWIVSWQTIG